jgi:hypothetical protein
MFIVASDLVCGYVSGFVVFSIFVQNPNIMVMCTK